jgi:hypothetical protein
VAVAVCAPGQGDLADEWCWQAAGLAQDQLRVTLGWRTSAASGVAGSLHEAEVSGDSGPAGREQATPGGHIGRVEAAASTLIRISNIPGSGRSSSATSMTSGP